MHHHLGSIMEPEYVASREIARLWSSYLRGCLHSKTLQPPANLFAFFTPMPMAREYPIYEKQEAKQYSNGNSLGGFLKTWQPIPQLFKRRNHQRCTQSSASSSSSHLVLWDCACSPGEGPICDCGGMIGSYLLRQ